MHKKRLATRLRPARRKNLCSAPSDTPDRHHSWIYWGRFAAGKDSEGRAGKRQRGREKRDHPLHQFLITDTLQKLPDLYSKITFNQ